MSACQVCSSASVEVRHGKAPCPVDGSLTYRVVELPRPEPRWWSWLARFLTREVPR